MEFIFCSVFDQTVFGDLHMSQKRVFIPKTIRVISVNGKNQPRKITEILFFIIYIRTPTRSW
jgi:hypothetical protein